VTAPQWPHGAVIDQSPMSGTRDSGFRDHRIDRRELKERAFGLLSAQTLRANIGNAPEYNQWYLEKIQGLLLRFGKMARRH